MNKSKIEWCDYTWNPVTGCLHGCEYCYARRIAERFMPHEMELMDIQDCKPIIPISFKNLGCYECDNTVYLRNFKQERIRMCPYPQGFKPTFHKYKLGEPSKLKKPSKIFVVSMGDLFGDWVPDEWIEEVFKACEAAPQHTYIFLTKNPHKTVNLNVFNAFKENRNWWFGTTITSLNDSYRAHSLFSKASWHANLFLSIEPLLSELEAINDIRAFKWIIVGAQTGPGAIPPKPEWVQKIIDQCRAADIPILLKDNLKWPERIQEFPEDLKPHSFY